MNDMPFPDQDSDWQSSEANAPEQRSAYLWTPWRMAYVAGTGKREAGCIFCNRLAQVNDVENLVLCRGDDVFAIMNLFPYNTGHLMVVPNVHTASPETLAAGALVSSTLLMQRSLRALRAALNCEGFNVGLNIGSPAGAGVADHMHQHIVPRWTGDTNFMPILSGAKVMPELLPVTYAKVRAELFRADCGVHPVGICCFESTGDQVAVAASAGTFRLPEIVPVDGEALWQTAFHLLESLGIRARLAGWGGTETAAAGQRSGFCFIAQRDWVASTKFQFIPVDEALQRLSSNQESEILKLARTRIRSDI